MPFDSSLKNSLGTIGSLDENLKECYEYYWNSGQSHFFFRNGVGSVHCRSFLKEKNRYLLIILPGRSEASIKYSELCFELQGIGFDLVVFDHRGQGFSERTGNKGNLNHINSWHEYVGDVLSISEHFKEQKEYKKTVVLGHSLGGALSLASQIRDSYFSDALILSSPMLCISPFKIPNFISKVALFILSQMGMRNSSTSLYRGQNCKGSFIENNLTSSLERYQFSLELKKRHPQIEVGAPTVQWLYEMSKLKSYIWNKKSHLDCAVLMMQAGQDRVVSNVAQEKYFDKVTNCRILKLKESMHEIFQERDDIRNRALVQVHKFLKEIKK